MNLYQKLVNCKGNIKEINKILEEYPGRGTEFTFEEIANIMHITEAEAKRIQHVAIIKLRNWRKARSCEQINNLLVYMEEGVTDEGEFI